MSFGSKLLSPIKRLWLWPSDCTFYVYPQRDSFGVGVCATGLNVHNWERKMTKPWTILAPVTLQGTSTKAIEHAVNVSNDMRAQLVLLHVISPAASVGPARTRFWPEAAMAEDAVDFGLRRVVRRGLPAPTIHRYAEEIQADLILMPVGASVWSPVRRSVTSMVLASTQRPVQLWNPSAAADAAPFRCRQLLCVVELDGDDGAVIEATNEMAARTDAKVEVLHIVPNATESLLFHSLDQPHRPLSSSLAAIRLRQLRAQLRPVVSTSIAVGEPHKSIVQTARRKAADVALVRRKAASSWSTAGWEHGAIVRNAGCPVISVAAPASGAERIHRPLWRSEKESVYANCD